MNVTSHISMKQGYTLFLLAGFAPAIRLASSTAAKLGDHAGWVSVIFACLIYCGLIYILHSLFQLFTGHTNLYDIYKTCFGKLGGNALTAIYTLWIFILIGFYIRSFAERFLTSIMPSTPIPFFIITLLILCYILLRGRFEHFARLISICFYVVCACLLFIFVFNLQNMHLQNFFPVTTLDSTRVLRAAYPFTGMFVYITLLMFIGDEISDRQSFKKLGLQSAAVLLAANLIIFFSTVGVFGSTLTQKLSLPFFMSSKIISIFDSIERLESLFVIIWFITDIAIIVMLSYILLRLIGKMTNQPHSHILKTPLLLGLYMFSIYFANNVFELAYFSEKIALAGNIVLCFAVPAVALGGGWIRKRFIAKRNRSED